MSWCWCKTPSGTPIIKETIWLLCIPRRARVCVCICHIVCASVTCVYFSHQKPLQKVSQGTSHVHKFNKFRNCLGVIHIVVWVSHSRCFFCIFTVCVCVCVTCDFPDLSHWWRLSPKLPCVGCRSTPIQRHGNKHGTLCCRNRTHKLLFGYKSYTSRASPQSHTPPRPRLHLPTRSFTSLTRLNKFNKHLSNQRRQVPRLHVRLHQKRWPSMWEQTVCTVMKSDQISCPVSILHQLCASVFSTTLIVSTPLNVCHVLMSNVRLINLWTVVCID